MCIPNSIFFFLSQRCEKAFLFPELATPSLPPPPWFLCPSKSLGKHTRATGVNICSRSFTSCAVDRIFSDRFNTLKPPCMCVCVCLYRFALSSQRWAGAVSPCVPSRASLLPPHVNVLVPVNTPGVDTSLGRCHNPRVVHSGRVNKSAEN